MNAINYIDAAKEKLGNISDYALAKRLGRQGSWISRYRSGRGEAFDDKAAIEIAEILDIDPLVVIADMHLQRRQDNHEFWESVKSKAGHAAVVMAIAGSSLMPVKSEAYEGLDNSQEYVLCAFGGFDGMVVQLTQNGYFTPF